MLTFTVTLAMWAMLRALEEEEPHPRLWAFLLAASLGTGLLLKSLVAVVFPLATGLIFLLVTRQLFLARTWKRLHPFSGLAIVLLIAAPWHILATLRNPPYFDFTFHSGPGPISRISLVLFHERASASLFEFALSAGLQHGSTVLFLAASSCLAISVERVSTRNHQAFF